jgi:hypothetical protein
LALAGIGVAVVFAMKRVPSSAAPAQQAADSRGPLAREVADFLKEGELERASEFAALLRKGQDTIDPRDPYLDTILCAEAFIYRYHDADPARLHRLEPHLGSGARSGPRLLAALAVQCRQQRASQLSALDPFRTELAEDTHYHYLRATALEVQGEIEAAREAWNRSAQLGPLWFAHRFEQAAFERRQGNEDAVTRIVQATARADPESAWSELGLRWFGKQKAPAAPAIASAEAGPGRPPVLGFHDHLLRALRASAEDNPSGARQELESAAQAVHRQPAFLLDAFDWILAAKDLGLARTLTELESWPKESALGRSQRERLIEAEQESDPVPRRRASSRRSEPR